MIATYLLAHLILAKGMSGLFVIGILCALLQPLAKLLERHGYSVCDVLGIGWILLVSIGFIVFLLRLLIA